MILLTLALALRLLYWSPGLLGGDAIGYAIGGLGRWIAHPPGFFGYCFAGWLINQAVADISDSLVLLNVASSLIGISACFFLARAFALPTRQALLATAAYAFSINLSFFSCVPLSYAPEGMFATVFAFLSWRGIQTQNLKYTLAATFLWALGGAFRQTTTYFLAPLWLLMLWQGGQLRRLPLHLLVAIPLIWSWNHANHHYLAASLGDLSRDVARDTWQLQMMMPANHDYARLGLDHDATQTSVSTYHLPLVEFATWFDETFGTRFMPDYRTFNAPPPSLTRALRLSAYQLAKQTFYLVFSLPALVLLLPTLRRLPAALHRFSWQELAFFACWILPVAAFFSVGHMGSFGYLQIYLSGASVLLTLILTRLSPSTTAAPTAWTAWQKGHAALTLGSILFFVGARPFISADPRQKLADITCLQYTGSAIHQRFATARSLANAPGRSKPEPWIHCSSDADIIAYWHTTPESKQALYQPRLVRPPSP